jgi:hypothetical protein
MCLFSVNCFAVTPWEKAEPLGSRDAADIDTYIQDNNTAVERLLSEYRRGASISYASASTLSVSAGSIMVSNADGSNQEMLKNTTATTVTWANIDTGAEGVSKTYNVFGYGDSSADTFSIVISESSIPSGITNYLKLGTFYNNSSGNIESVTNENNSILTGTVAHGGTIPLPSGFTADQCKWFVSANNLREYDTIGGSYTTREGWSYFYCSASSARVVTCYVADGSETNTGTANYIIIGVK